MWKICFVGFVLSLLILYVYLVTGSIGITIKVETEEILDPLVIQNAYSENITKKPVTIKTYEDSVKGRFLGRRDNLRKICDDDGSTDMQEYLLSDMSTKRSNLFYIDEYKMLYCSVPKAGCTNWKKVLFYLADLLTPEEREDAENGRLWKIKGEKVDNIKNWDSINFWHLNKTEREYRLKNYTKFLAVREPIERLLSAYRNKLENLTADKKNPFTKMSREIHAYISKMDDDKLATFDEFLKALVDHTPNALVQNNHWQSFGSLCFPCDVKYDYIMKLDTINEDSDFLFQTLGIKNITYPKGYKNSTTEGMVQQTFKELPVGLVQAVYEYLKKDYRLFGYPAPASVNLEN